MKKVSAVGASRDTFLNLLIAQSVSLRAFIFHWRDLHLNLPRANLGSASTRSLIGAPDAIAAVHRMVHPGGIRIRCGGLRRPVSSSVR